MGALSPFDGGVRLRLRVQPRASRDQIDGFVADELGLDALKVAVTALPEGGKANAQVIKLLAKAYGLRKSDMTIIQGLKDRRKVVEIKGDPQALSRIFQKT